MSEVKNNQNQAFKPRPKPTLAEVKESGIKNVIGVAPRPKPDFSKKPIPPRPAPKAPSRPKPPIKKVEPQEEKKVDERPANNNDATFQAYNNMLNNIQLMNAIGLVNGIYQNAQNNRVYDRPANLDKQTLFEEFYDYLTTKMKKDGKLNLEDLKESVQNSNDIDNNSVHTAVTNAKKQGLSLEQYLESMCNEDEFIKFNLYPLKVENLNLTKAILSPVPFVKAYDYGDVVAVGEYTNDDYQNLVNQNYSVYVDALQQGDAKESHDFVVDEIIEPPKEVLEDVQPDNAVEDDIQEQLDDILNKEVEQAKTEEDAADHYENVEDDENVFEDLYANAEENSFYDANEQLDDILDDIGNDSKKIEKEEISKTSDEEQAKLQSMKNQALIDFLNNEDQEESPVVVEENNSENADYGDFVYNTLHYDEVQRKKDQYNQEKIKTISDDNDKLKNQIEQLRNIVGDLKQEVDSREEDNEKLKREYEVVNTRNKEKDKAIAKTNSNMLELERENRFMKDVVQSLLVEVEELKAKIAKQERLSKVAKTKTPKADKKPTYEIIAPVPKKEEAKEPEQEVKQEIIAEPVEEKQEIQEMYAQENLTKVQDSDFDSETYNVDGIIVDEDGSEVSGHFVDKIKNATGDIKHIYNEVRNCLMSYREVKGRCSSACDTFRLNGDIVAKFLLIGKTIKLYLALDPNDEELPQNIYHQKDESKKKAYKETPFMVRLQSDLAVRKAKKLIEYMFDKLDVDENTKYEYVDYANTLERQTVKNK